MEVEQVTGAGAVLERVEGLLLADEARHNLPLGILSTARESPTLYPEVHCWIARDGTRVAGAAIRTPPYNLVLARPADGRAIDALAWGIEDDLPGVVGAVPEVDAFAAGWATRRGVDVTPVVEQRIYALRELTAPAPVPGAPRLAGAADRALVLAWVRAFSREALHGEDDEVRVERTVDARLQGGESGIGLWEADGSAVSLAGFGGRTPNGIRIGPVYTPPEHRNRGYGSAVTAAVSKLSLEAGHRFCFLYTDLANPTSNSIYQRIGYEPVCDSRELSFGRRGACEGAPAVGAPSQAVRVSVP